MRVLVLNCGSSSVKFALIEFGGGQRTLARGLIELTAAVASHQQAVRIALDRLMDGAIRKLEEIDAVGHRVVHGGERFHQSAAIDDEVLRGIEECAVLAPLHNPHNLSGFYACRELLPRAVHVAVFDTAFHQTLSAKAYTYALPHQLAARYKLRRYGFHGTSHRYMAERFAELAGGVPQDYRLITCHLGNGCSMCAIDRGRSVDTSMGLTPLEGLVMGTRCGDIDAAAVLHVMRWERLDVERMDSLLNKESGLYGISGISNDMRALLESERHSDPRARLALEVFCYRIRKYIGAYFAALNGADAIVFTGGIGENAAPIRARACESLDALGILLDPARNEAAAGREVDISDARARTRVWVIPTNEELLIARETAKVLGKPG